jgi:hypothetical protein
MTLVAVWKTENRINAIADTRIGCSAGRSLTEHGPKILALPVSCKQPGADGDFSNEVFRTSLGFAFAGATLPALASLALASTLCARLIAAPGAPHPSLHEIANAVGVIALQYIREVGQHTRDDPRFTSIVFGFCMRTSRFLAFELTPVLEPNQVNMTVTEHDLGASNHVVIIGTSSDHLRDRINQLREAAEHQVLIDDAPTRALKDVIAERVDARVGGSIQQAFVWEQGFVPMATATPQESGFTFNVLGLDVSTAFKVGAYRVGMMGRF